MKLIDSIVENAAEMTALRKEIHAQPELSFEESHTSDLVARKLTEWGIPIHRGLGKTGVVGIVKGRDDGASGRAIGLRADMDALPMQELNGFAHASQVPGKMHACGHDGHTTMLLAAARYLASQRNFDGTVYLIFQPAEEGGGGGREMLKDGMLELFPMDAIFGMHNWPGMKPGTMAASPGPVMASTNEFKITVRGKGGHAAMPHMVVDPVPVACQLVLAFQTIVSRNVKPIDSAVVSVTMVHGGDASNVVPDSIELQGTVRTFSRDVLDLVESRMEQLTRDLCSAYGAQADFRFIRNYPATVNTAKEADFARSVMAEIVGPENALEQEPSLAAEDFAYMLEARPGAYCFIANGDGEHRAHGHGLGPCTLHNPSYDFNDELIPLGATYWGRLVERWFEQQD